MDDLHSHAASLDDALEFVNTRERTGDGYIDHLPDLPSAVLWLEGHGLVHQETRQRLLWTYEADLESQAHLLRRVTRLRDGLRELLDAAYEQRRPGAGALAEVNRALRGPDVHELVPAADGVALSHRHEGDPIDEALSRLAEPVVREVAGPGAARLRVCANDECRWVFKDESPAGRRKWCSMAVCGNRAKVARHRQRLRAQA